MQRTAIMLASFVITLDSRRYSQESRSEISLQGTGFFTKDTNGNGISRTTSDTGGFQGDTAITSNRWLSAEGDYGFDRNTQRYFAAGGQSESSPTYMGSRATWW